MKSKAVEILEHLINPDLKDILASSSQAHNHLCPRQILGARIGIAGANALRMAIPRTDKNLLVIVETDGCFVSGVQAATGCFVTRRTLRVEDMGKIAATFINVTSEEAVRIAPKPDVREKAWLYAPKEQKKRYYAMLHGYQLMPETELLNIQNVKLNTPIGSIISRAGVRVNCQTCFEEIINEREVLLKGKIICKHCAKKGYYSLKKT